MPFFFQTLKFNRRGREFGGTLSWEVLRKVQFNHSERQRLYLPTLLPLLYGLTQAQGIKGEVILMDVADASILCFAALHDASVLNDVTPEERKNYGEGMFCASRVKNVDFIGIETEEGSSYVEWFGNQRLPVEVIMPAVSYLSFVECGYQPSNLLEWDGGSATLEGAFVESEFAPLVNAIMQLCPEGINQLSNYLDNLGIVPRFPKENPCDLRELMNNEMPPAAILDWICQVAMGEGLINQFPKDDDEPGSLAVSAESTQMLKEVLKKSGAENITKAAADDKENRIGGYTYVTEPDSNNNRYVCLFGYFPVDEPKYGISVWFQKKVQEEDEQVKEEAELKAHAADICKRIVDYMMKNETNKE